MRPVNIGHDTHLLCRRHGNPKGVLPLRRKRPKRNQLRQRRSSLRRIISALLSFHRTHLRKKREAGTPPSARSKEL